MPPDRFLSAWITDFAGTYEIFDEFMRVMASNYFAPRIAIVVVLCLWFGTRNAARREHNQRAIITVAVGVVIGFAIAESLCLLQDHIGDFWARPYDGHANAQAATDLLYFKLPDSSFPSNAMCGIVPIAIGLWFADKRASIIVWGVVLAWAIGRVYVGIHYPIDIVGGMLIGMIGILVARKLVKVFDSQVSLILATARRLYLA